MEDEESEDEGKKLEDVRMSNFAYSQTKISEYISFYFASLGVGCSIVASEIRFFYNLDDINKPHIIYLLTIANCSTIFLSKFAYALLPFHVVLSIIAQYQLRLQWKKTKNYLTKTDNLYSTGELYWLIFEITLNCIMNYPSLYDSTYVEEYTAFDPTTTFYVNDILLCIMIFIRMIYLVRVILAVSFYSDPRAQRVCDIYGADANNVFAIKAMMVEYSWILVALSCLITMLMFSYQIRLFERVIQSSFYHITASMWNIFITMTTVGYGDLFAQTHGGRTIAIFCAFWGVFICSLFIQALTNILTFNFSEKKSFHLLQRLQKKESMRK